MSEQLTREQVLAEIRHNVALLDEAPFGTKMREKTEVYMQVNCEEWIRALLSELDRQHDEFYNEVRIRDQEIEELKRQLNPPLATGLKPLKGTRAKVYDYLTTYIAQHGYSPSNREIAEAIGLKSGSTAHGHLERLEKAGYIDRNGGKPRAIKITGARESAK